MIRLVRLIQSAAQIFQILIVVRAVLSWLNINPYNQAYQMLLKITDPVLEKIRYYLDKFIPNLGIDLSPIVAIILIDVLENLIISLISH